MTILNNTNKYLSPELIEQCFERNKINYVDKVVTGNGFTTGFGYLKPAFNKVNILIAPNQSIVKDKEKEYTVGKFAPNKRCAFVYEGNGLKGKHSDYDLIVLVADSFLNFSYVFKDHIDKLMVDEFHSVIVQSPFRRSLRKLTYSLENDFKEAAISFVTASPLLYSKIDIQIENKYMDDRILHTSSDVKESIKRCVESIKSGKKTLIFIQDATIVKNILKAADRTNFRLISGSNFQSTLLTKSIYKLDDNSNIVICSSAAFEGWSDYSIGGHSYIYMNLGNKHNTFLGCNIYQALGRLREGYEYAEICCTRLGGGGFANNIIESLNEKIDKFIQIDKHSIEQKQSKSFEFSFRRERVKAKDLKPYVFFKRDKNKYTMLKYYHAIDVHNETKQIDTQLKLYTNYLRVRKIELKDIDVDITQKRMMSRVNADQRIINIVTNIRDNNLQDNFMSFFFKSFNPENKIKYYVNEISILQSCAFELDIELDDKYEILKQYLLKGGYYKELRDVLRDASIKWGSTKREIAESLKTFEDTTFQYTLDVAIGITLGYFESNMVGHRDYNKLTQIGIDLIEFIALKLNREVTEVDIRNCFPRIIYALNGYALPSDFYGEDRQKNKKRINILLNSFRYNRDNLRPFETQKKDSKRKLINSGIKEDVVDWLVNNYFDTDFKGDFFNFLAYHERVIIGSAMEKIKQSNPDIELFRRHDSFLCFNELSYKVLNDFEYLGVNGWFDSFKPNDNDFILKPLLF